MQLITNNGADVLMAAALTVTPAATGPLLGAKVHLCVTNFPYDRGTLLADLITGEATYTGYAAGAVTWLAPSIADDGTVEILGTVPVFVPSDAVTPNQIYGAWLADSTDAQLWGCGAFDGAPLPMLSPTDMILVTLRWRPLQGALVVVVS